MARCATPVAAGIAKTRTTGNNAARHFSLVLVQATCGTAHQDPLNVPPTGALPFGMGGA